MNLKNKEIGDLLNQEWLESNGIGGYSSSSITGANTRKYHGLLVAGCGGEAAARSGEGARQEGDDVSWYRRWLSCAMRLASRPRDRGTLACRRPSLWGG